MSYLAVIEENNLQRIEEYNAYTFFFVRKIKNKKNTIFLNRSAIMIRKDVI
jgi:hypothetical protein